MPKLADADRLVRHARYVNTLLALVGMLLALVLLWAGIKRLDVSSHWKAVISILELMVLGASVVLLGWLGAVFFIVANLLAVIVSSIRLAMQREEKLVYASTQCGASKQELEELDKEMQQNGSEPNPFALLGPLRRADLICRLAQRARTVAEMRQMARPIAMLWVVHRSDLDWLVDRFDQLLRLNGMDASESMRLADMLSASTNLAAATFEEMVEATVAATS